MTTYKELAERYSVSADTIRKQLDAIAQIQGGDDTQLRTRNGRQWNVSPYGMVQLESFRQLGVDAYRRQAETAITPVEVLPPDRQSTALTVRASALATQSQSQIGTVESLLDSAIESIQFDLEQGQSIEQLLQQARRQKLANESTIQAIEDYQATRGHYQGTIEKLRLAELGVVQNAKG